VGDALSGVEGLAVEITARIVGLRRWDGNARIERVLVS
jgi:hypothetical protein